MNEKNINNDNELEICSSNIQEQVMKEMDIVNPLMVTHGDHLVCAKMNKEFINYTKNTRK